MAYYQTYNHATPSMPPSYYPSPSMNRQFEDYDKLDQFTGYQQHHGYEMNSNQDQPAARATFTRKLVKAVAIPSLKDQSAGQFLRAYPPVLEEFGLSKDVFLRFLDDLNTSPAAGAPLSAIGMAGNIMSFAPSVTLQIVGTVVSVGSSLGKAGTDKLHSNSVLKTANANIFGPKGLKIEIVNFSKLRSMTGVPSGLQGQSGSFLAPPQYTDPTMQQSREENGVRMLEPWIAYLEIIKSPSRAASSPMGRLSAKANDRQRRNSEEKEQRRQEKRDRSKGRHGRQDRQKPPKEDKWMEDASWVLITNLATTGGDGSVQAQCRYSQ